MATGTIIKNTCHNTIANNVDISSYNSTSNRYTCPCDGWIIMEAHGGEATISLANSSMGVRLLDRMSICVPVPKGMTVNFNGSFSYAIFRSFN